MYFELHKVSEAPAIFHRWSVSTALAAWLGRQCWFPFGDQRIFPNQYVMFIGDPGSRKSTAIKAARNLIRQAGYDTFAPKKTSKEKFLADLMTGMAGQEDDNKDISEFDILATESQVPRECFVVADEFNVFAGHGNLEFLEILGDMWDWDDERDPWKYQLKNSKSVRIWQPTISILGGNTPTGFTECFPAAAIGQGFMSRTILIYGEATGKKITIPPKVNEKLLTEIIKHLLHIKQNMLGPVQLTEEAFRAVDMIYKSWQDLEDQRFRHYSTRRFIHLLKLCLIYSAARASKQIQLVDVVQANTVLSFAETQMPKAIGELGKAKNAEATNKVMQALYGTRKPMQPNELWPIVRMDLEKPIDLNQILHNLEAAGKIQLIELAGNRSGYLPKQKIINNAALYVDQKYLKGKELLV